MCVCVSARVCVCRGGTHLVRAAVGILAGGRERKRDIEEGEKERWMGGDEKGALCALSGTQQVQIERKKDAGRKRGDFIFFSVCCRGLSRRSYTVFIPQASNFVKLPSKIEIFGLLKTDLCVKVSPSARCNCDQPDATATEICTLCFFSPGMV